VLLFVVACASRQKRTYPDQGVITYLDTSAATIGGSLDATEVELHYRGGLAQNIEDLQVVEASATNEQGGRAAVFRELQKKAQQLNADGVYDLQWEQTSSGIAASGIAFRFKR
ncbi:MAG: hypothetical protein N2Z22_02960, partial [Turneriella sp.]|nr:hypothetical protein [Turneriella sp.]